MCFEKKKKNVHNHCLRMVFIYSIVFVFSLPRSTFALEHTHIYGTNIICILLTFQWLVISTIFFLTFFLLIFRKLLCSPRLRKQKLWLCSKLSVENDLFFCLQILRIIQLKFSLLLCYLTTKNVSKIQP